MITLMITLGSGDRLVVAHRSEAIITLTAEARERALARDLKDIRIHIAILATLIATALKARERGSPLVGYLRLVIVGEREREKEREREGKDHRKRSTLITLMTLITLIKCV